jgi:glycerol-3-phosphate acyltransferase PlsY
MTNNLWLSIEVALACFILGSIPVGLLLTRFAGLGDIRQIGSGSIGATNVLRTGRKDIAAATLVLDALKGALAVALATRLLGPDAAWPAGLLAVIGHCYSMWLKGRGGKGVATALGVLLAIAWPVGLACGATWLVVMAAFRISSAAALATCVLAPLYVYLLADPTKVAVAGAISLLVIMRHRDNILRLLAGTEPRVGGKK